jgi:hypothetical protein
MALADRLRETYLAATCAEATYASLVAWLEQQAAMPKRSKVRGTDTRPGPFPGVAGNWRASYELQFTLRKSGGVFDDDAFFDAVARHWDYIAHRAETDGVKASKHDWERLDPSEFTFVIPLCAPTIQ